MPVGTTYLAGSADTVQNYADTYVNFTTSLITDTFEALLQAHHSQVEAYAELVNTLSQGITTYINETSNDVSIDEVLNFLSSLPLHDSNLLEEGNTLSYIGDAQNNDPILAIEDSDGNINSFSGVAETIMNPTGSSSPIILELVQGITDIFTKPRDKVSSDPLLDPYAKFNTAVSSNNNRSVEEAFIDLVKTVISYNKYGLLENMVETGLIRLIIDRGLIRTDFNMELTESFNDSSEDKLRHRIKAKEKKRTVGKGGLIQLLTRRHRVKNSSQRKALTVSKKKNTQSSNTSGTAQLKAQVEIHFSTDYKPLILDNS